MGDLKKFWKSHPVLSIVYGISGVFIIDRTFRAFAAKPDGFWGLGATTSTSTTTSTSHRTTPTDNEPTIPIPMQFHGVAGRSLTTSSSAPHGKGRRSDYGEDTYETNIELSGVPNSIKRRIATGEYTSNNDTYSSINPRTPDIVNADSIMGMDGSINQMSGIGWM
jgi:hypothetical protein